jgi:Xaa-Pro dipeptidase
LPDKKPTQDKASQEKGHSANQPLKTSYFSHYALQQVYLKSPQHAKYINAPLLENYYPIGGVRIEDDILVTADGGEILTTAPKGEEACRIIRGEESTEIEP